VADVVACADEDGIDGVAAGVGVAVAFEQARQVASIWFPSRFLRSDYVPPRPRIAFTFAGSSGTG